MKIIPSPEECEQFAITSSQIEREYSDIAYTDHRLAFQQLLQCTAPLTAKDILECHFVLLQALEPEIAGKYRTFDVMIGGKVAPSSWKVQALMDGWLAKYGNPEVFLSAPDIRQAIKDAHVEFEQIHPFGDGNGRTGRCIMNWHFAMCGMPILIIKPGPEQMAYYKWFDKKK